MSDSHIMTPFKKRPPDERQLTNTALSKPVKKKNCPLETRFSLYFFAIIFPFVLPELVSDCSIIEKGKKSSCYHSKQN